MRTLPKNGSYKFATNPMTNAQELGTWYISDSLKIIRALSEEECNEILEKNGFKSQEWQAYGAKDNTIGKMDLEKLLKINNYLNENAYDLNYIEFLSLIGTTVDEYCAKNGLDVNEIWETLNTVRKEVFEEIGEADYMKK